MLSGRRCFLTLQQNVFTLCLYVGFHLAWMIIMDGLYGFQASIIITTKMPLPESSVSEKMLSLLRSPAASSFKRNPCKTRFYFFFYLIVCRINVTLCLKKKLHLFLLTALKRRRKVNPAHCPFVDICLVWFNLI